MIKSKKKKKKKIFAKRENVCKLYCLHLKMKELIIVNIGGAGVRIGDKTW
jgi:hypothetical protein